MYVFSCNSVFLARGASHPNGVVLPATASPLILSKCPQAEHDKKVFSITVCLFWRTPAGHPPHKVVLPFGCHGPLALRDSPEGELLPTDPEARSGGRSERAFHFNSAVRFTIKASFPTCLSDRGSVRPTIHPIESPSDQSPALRVVTANSHLALNDC